MLYVNIMLASVAVPTSIDTTLAKLSENVAKLSPDTKAPDEVVAQGSSCFDGDGRALEDYHGTMSTTDGGYRCKAWSDASHYNHLPSNYCRNPDSEPRPWCYTENGPRWELCPVTKCSSGDVGCYDGTTMMSSYSGKKSTTVSGKTCKRWADAPAWTSLSDHGNYCRNPDNEPEPWCYTTDPNTRWEFCGVPKCANRNNGASKSIPSSLLLRKTNLLETHDAGTGYCGSGGFAPGSAAVAGDSAHFLPCSTYQTQEVNPVDQLNCGVRAFDMRPWYSGGPWASDSHGVPFSASTKGAHYQHKAVTDQTFEEDIPKLLTWGRAHPDELFIFYVNHCSGPDVTGGDDCQSRLYEEIFTSRGVAVLRSASSCTTGSWHCRNVNMNSLKAAEALSYAKSSSGTGLVAIIEGDVEEMWGGLDPPVYDYLGWAKDGFNVFSDDDTNEENMEGYYSRVRAKLATGSVDNQMWAVQAFYQQDIDWTSGSFAAEVPSSDDLNSRTHSEADNGEWNDVNMLEINFVCQDGVDIALALYKSPNAISTVSYDDEAACRRACGSASANLKAHRAAHKSMVKAQAMKALSWANATSPAEARKMARKVA